MAEALEFTNIEDALAVYPELPWKSLGGRYGKVLIFDAKKDDYDQISRGQYIVSIGERFEVHDEEPEKAKTVEPPTDDEPAEEAKSAKAPSRKANETPKSDEPNAHEAEGIKGPVTKTNENTE